MKYIKPILLAILTQFVALLAPIFVLLAIPFIIWDKEPSLDFQGNNLATRGDLPKWLYWLSTPDERLPGGLYEDTVRSVFLKYGKYICTFYWLGVRNRMHGFASQFGEFVDFQWVPTPGFYTNGKFWFIRKHFMFNKLSFKAGYRIYSLKNNKKLAVPCFTITKI